MITKSSILVLLVAVFSVALQYVDFAELSRKLHTMSQNERAVAVPQYLPRVLDNVYSAVFMLQMFRGNPRSLQDAERFSQSNMATPYPLEGYPNLYTLPSDGKYSPLWRIAQTVRSHMQEGKKADEVIDFMRTVPERKENIYDITYDVKTDSGWVVLQVPGSSDASLNDDNLYKTWQWHFSVMVLPLQPVYNVVALRGEEGVQLLESLEASVRRALGSPRTRERMIEDVRRAHHELAKKQGKTLSPAMETTFADLASNNKDLADRLEIYHYPFPYCELAQMHPKVGASRSDAFAVHAPKVISNRRMIAALKILDKSPLTSAERKLAKRDWSRFLGERKWLANFWLRPAKWTPLTFETEQNLPPSAEGFRERFAPLGTI